MTAVAAEAGAEEAAVEAAGDPRRPRPVRPRGAPPAAAEVGRERGAADPGEGLLRPRPSPGPGRRRGGGAETVGEAGTVGIIEYDYEAMLPIRSYIRNSAQSCLKISFK